MGRLTGIDLFFLRKMVLVDRRITPVEKEWKLRKVESSGRHAEFSDEKPNFGGVGGEATAVDRHAT